MTEDFIKSHCLKCRHHFDESIGEDDWGGHFCWIEVYGADTITLPSLDEMEECPLSNR